jgi:hypothetical protein
MTVFETWSRAREHLLDAIEQTNGTHNEDDVLLMLLNGTHGSKLWLFEKSALITEFINFPRLKALNVWLVGGDLDELRTVEPQLIEYAKQNQCIRISGGGRFGWSRVRSDWKKAGVYMYKDL